VFVTRSDAKPIQSLDDPDLRSKSIGVQILEEDYAPPGQALGRRGLSANVHGFDMDNPGAIIDGVAQKKVDVAIVWGPLAGYYAAKYGNRLRLAPVQPEIDPPNLPFTFAIGAGVRKTAPDLYQHLSAALAKEQPAIQRVLRSYHVPLLPLANQQQLSVGGMK
jgi:mxaJ protein